MLKAVISEKSYNLANSQNKYTFWVEKAVSKQSIAKEVEEMYKVEVESVRVITRPGKISTNWRVNRKSRKPDRRKAVVQLKKDQKIDDFFNI